VLNIGTNNLASDRAEDIAKGIGDAVKLIKQEAPEATVIVMALFPSGGKPDEPRRKNAMAVNRLIAKLANVKVLDISAQFLLPDGSQDRTKMSEDTIHLVAGGYVAWGQALKPLIEKI